MIHALMILDGQFHALLLAFQLLHALQLVDKQGSQCVVYHEPEDLACKHRYAADDRLDRLAPRRPRR